jgi:hypothetical protein
MELSNYIVTKDGEIKYSYYHQELNRLLAEYQEELIQVMRAQEVKITGV